MFKAIEGNEGKEENYVGEMKIIRDKLAKELWNISCCELNGFNQTAYYHE